MNTDVRSAEKGVVITPNDTGAFPETRGVYVGVSGDVTVVWPDQTTTLFKAAANGEHPWSVVGVTATGTTATFLVAVY